MRNTLRLLWLILTAPIRLIWRIPAGFVADFVSMLRAEVDLDSTVLDAVNKAIDHPTDLLYHVAELRRYLMRAVLALMITTGITAYFFDTIMDWLTRPLPGGSGALQIIEVTEPISVFMRVSLFGGFALAFPYLALELWMFAGSGLARKTRFLGLAAIPAATLLFLSGVAFAYFVMLPTALPFLLNIGGFEQAPRVISFIKFVTGLCFWIGAAFEFPLIIYFLARAGVVNSTQLRQQWRLAVVVIAVVAALITPTVDPVNMGLVMGPMFLLYLLSIFLAFLARPKPVPV